ncbi:Neuroligin-4, Y-linked [Pseudolycoriella hygida]|uniref:Neuroligin-4, Y-linked n=1 Tax=Pseudolycoriella hygida TaxID=35572 RepID=A0A9Q0MP44_9DIPT|nr:Neuroligin-4, Y-linked [Pseudolycoriella hygida]
MIMKVSFFYTILYILKLTTSSTLDLYKNARLGSRIIQTRYGRLQGLVVPLENYKFLRPIEAYLGVPYATPPTKSNRVNKVEAKVETETFLFFGWRKTGIGHNSF